jgi:hypothetical protein
MAQRISPDWLKAKLLQSAFWTIDPVEFKMEHQDPAFLFIPSSGCSNPISSLRNHSADEHASLMPSDGIAFVHKSEPPR